MSTTGTVARALASRVVAIGAGFLLTIVVARTLPVEKAGLFFLMYSLLAVGATIGRLGSETLALKLAGRPSIDEGEIRSLWMVTLAVSTIVASAFGIVLALSGVLSPLIAALTALGTIPQALSVLAGSILRARGRLSAGILAELGFLPVISTIGIALWSVIAGPSIEAALVVFTTGAVVTALWAVPMAIGAMRSVDRTVDATPVLLVFRRNLRSQTAMMATALLVFVVAWAPVFILSSLGLFAEVALYTAAARLANFISLVPNVQVSLLAPRFASSYLDGALTELNTLARRSARIATAVAALPAIVVVAAPAWLLTTTYGEPLSPAAPALIVLGLGAFVTVALGQVSSLLLLCDLEGRGFLLNLVLLCGIAAFGYLLAPVAGLVGIASVVAVASVIYAVAGSVLLRRRRGVRSTV